MFNLVFTIIVMMSLTSCALGAPATEDEALLKELESLGEELGVELLSSEQGTYMCTQGDATGTTIGYKDYFSKDDLLDTAQLCKELSEFKNKSGNESIAIHNQEGEDIPFYRGVIQHRFVERAYVTNGIYTVKIKEWMSLTTSVDGKISKKEGYPSPHDDTYEIEMSQGYIFVYYNYEFPDGLTIE